jgi:uncharacterized protein (TIGR03382 family)
MLDELPDAGDPGCPGPGGPAPHGFTTHNRFIRGKNQAYVGPTGCEGIRYHGLDYMLLHNLYAIATPGTWNGDPNADPCAVLPMPGDDAGTMPGTDAPPGDDEGQPAGGGCCDAGGGEPPWLFVLAVMLVLRRRR